MKEASESAVLAAARAWIFLSHPRLVLQFVRRLGYVPDPAFPKTYNEKLLWRKIFDHDPRFAVFSDKLAAKEYARLRCPDLAIPRTLWAGEAAEAIPDDALSGDVVVKASHGFGFNYFVSDGRYDHGTLVRDADRWLRTVHGRVTGEWAYRPIRPRVFVEERLPLGGGDEPTDIKVHACDGRIVHGWAVNKATGRAITLSASGDSIAPASGYATEAQALSNGDRLRALFGEACRFATPLSRGVDYARYDFLATARQLYFGEITVYPAAGYDSWSDPSIALQLTRCWDLRKSAFLAVDRTGLTGLYVRALLSRLDRLRRVGGDADPVRC